MICPICSDGHTDESSTRGLCPPCKLEYDVRVAREQGERDAMAAYQRAQVERAANAEQGRAHVARIPHSNAKTAILAAIAEVENLRETLKQALGYLA